MDTNSTKEYQNYAMGPLNQTLVSLTCIFSMLGSVFIVVSFIAWRDIRSISRRILIWISICDFFIALGNMCGTFFKPQNIDYPCIVQSFVVSTALISSFLWSVTLAACLYMTIVKNKFALFQSYTYLLHLFNWSVGLIINIMAAATGKLGNSADQITAGWCWIKHNRSHFQLSTSSKHSGVQKEELMWMILDYKGIEIISYASILIIFLMIKCSLSREIKAHSPSPGVYGRKRSVMNVAKKADRKLIFIPVLLICARLPGTIRFLVFAAGEMPRELTTWSKVLLSLQGIGDSAQGLLNCIFFCFLQRKVLKHLKEAFDERFGFRIFKRSDKVLYPVTTDNDSTTNAKAPLLDKHRMNTKYS